VKNIFSDLNFSLPGPSGAQAGQDGKLDRVAILEVYRALYQLAGLANVDSSNAQFLKLFKKAFRFVLNASQELPYGLGLSAIFETIEIAVITAEKFRLGAKSIACALLYSLCRARLISDSLLRKEFGEEIAHVVSLLMKTSDTVMPISGYSASTLDCVLKRFADDHCLAILIKLAECLHKMYRINRFVNHERMKIAEEAQTIYIPLAHHLGLSNVYLELEDLYLKFENEATYDNVFKKLRAKKTAPAPFLEGFVNSIACLLQQRNINYEIKGRTKSIASICHKIRERKIPFESIYDLYAIRIIFDSSPEQEYADCWSIYDEVIKLYEPKMSNLRDWVSYPKESGYEALHIAVKSSAGQWVEVQIRAKSMDDKAEHGEAAHWKYKSSNLGKDFEGMDEGWLEKAREFLAPSMASSYKQLLVSVNKVYIAS
jgi:guanosine-3',5'-bis(diphosphate) 3'-pyrophosphohydrolase